MFSGKNGGTRYIWRSGPDELSHVWGCVQYGRSTPFAVLSRFYRGQQEECAFEELYASRYWAARMRCFRVSFCLNNALSVLSFKHILLICSSNCSCSKALICVLLMYIFVTKCLSVMNSFLPCFLTSQDSGFKVEDLIMFMSIWIQKLKLHYSRGFEKIFRLLVLQVFLNPWSKLFQIVKWFFSLVIN